MSVVSVILAGGSGTRLWPISRTSFPKPFLKFNNDFSFFQEAILRHKNIVDKYVILLLEDHYFIAVDQVKELNLNKEFVFIIQSLNKNNAPAVAFASFFLNEDDTLIVSPSDHLISPFEDYENSVISSLKFLEQYNDKIVTFGIKPSFPNTSYGYIELGEKISSSFYNIKTFKEKPDLETAKKYLDKGSFFWNSGIFVFKAKTFLEDFEKFEPEMYNDSKKAFFNSEKNDAFIRIKKEFMENMASKSIDFAVIEKTNKGVVSPVYFNWSDIGNFDSLYEILNKDSNENAVHSVENSFLLDSEKNLVLAPKEKNVVAFGVKNFIIVDTPDALLVFNRGEAHKMKDIVSFLKEKNNVLLEKHVSTFRPWGSYTVLLNSESFNVRKVVVRPKKRLTLHSHNFRNEYWIVLKGKAKVFLDSEEIILDKDESIFIPKGKKHKLENPFDEDLIILEVQVGEKVSEEDINVFEYY